MNKSDEKLADESVKGTVSSEHHLTVSKSGGLAVGSFVPIEGMQDLPASIIRLPYVKLVQKMTSKAKLKSGKDAEVGSFYFSDTQEALTEFEFVILRAKIIEREYTDDNVTKKSTQLFSLIMLDDMSRMYILILPVTSFSPWGELINHFKTKGVKNAWDYLVNVRSEDAQNKKGQHYKRAKFSLGRKLTEVETSAMENQYGEYGGVLERRDIEEEGDTE